MAFETYLSADIAYLANGADLALISNDATDGIYVVHVQIASAPTEGQTVNIEITEKARSADTADVIFSDTIFHANAYETPPLVLMHSWSVTVSLKGGSNDASIWYRISRIS